eukprot:3160210-Rhodomonas_salina.1
MTGRSRSLTGTARSPAGIPGYLDRYPGAKRGCFAGYTDVEKAVVMQVRNWHSVWRYAMSGTDIADDATRCPSLLGDGWHLLPKLDTEVPRRYLQGSIIGGTAWLGTLQRISTMGARSGSYQ